MLTPECMLLTSARYSRLVNTSGSVALLPPALEKVLDMSNVVVGLLPSANVKYAPTNPYAVVELSLITLLVLSKILILTLSPFTTASPYLESNDALTVVFDIVEISIGLAISKSNVASFILVFASAKILLSTF